MPMLMYCDKQGVIFISKSLVFHGKTKDIEINCHFIRDKLLMGFISTPHVSSLDQSLASSQRALSMCCMIS